MDRILKITIGLLIITLALTVGYAALDRYVGGSYMATLSSTSSYTLSITTDQKLSNVTLFVPVPADTRGNSLAVSLLSARAMPGLPGSWQTTLFDTGKATLLKIHIPLLEVPAGTTPTRPHTVTLTAELPAEPVIDTADPLKNSPVFRPVQNFREEACSGYGAGRGGSPVCGAYLTSVYADYSADPNTAVTITSSYTGRNSWNVFEQKSNEYTSTISLLMHGENHGWATAKATIAWRIGSYDFPFRIS
jgi:hypothetical protein